MPSMSVSCDRFVTPSERRKWYAHARFEGCGADEVIYCGRFGADKVILWKVWGKRI